MVGLSQDRVHRGQAIICNLFRATARFLLPIPNATALHTDYLNALARP